MNNPLFAAVANHLWQSTLFAAGIGVVTLLFRKNSASVRYALWLAASLKFLVPFALLAALSSAFVPNHPIALPVAAVESGFVPAIQVIAAPVPPLAQFSAPAALSHGWVEALLFAATVVWALGAVTAAARRFRQWRQVRRLARESTPVDIEFLVAVRSSSSQLEPAVVGVFRPVLLIPQGICERLTSEQMRAVLAHERGHVIRRDNLGATLHMLVETLFWFHPLVWWLGARLIAEREQACDEQVLREGHNPASYAEGILKVCEHYMASRLPSAAGVSGANLEQRIGGIMRNPTIMRLSAIQRSVLVALAGVAILAPVLAGLLSPPPVHAADRLNADLERVAQTPVITRTRIALTAPGAGIGSFGFKETDDGYALRNPMPSGTFLVRNHTLREMLVFAYQMNPSRIDGPDWLDATRFDVDIPLGRERDGHAVTDLQPRVMLGLVLRTRFGLKLKFVPREMPGYVLQIANSALVPQPVPAETPDGIYYMSYDAARATASALQPLVTYLSMRLDAPIVDETQLRRRYNYEVKWGLGSSGATLLDAGRVTAGLQSQLGLELRPQKVTVPKLTVTSMKPLAEIIS